MNAVKVIMKYEFSSSGIRINGNDSYHVVKVVDADEWVLIRLRDGVKYEAGRFVSPDEARAFVHCLDLKLERHLH